MIINNLYTIFYTNYCSLFILLFFAKLTKFKVGRISTRLSSKAVIIDKIERTYGYKIAAPFCPKKMCSCLSVKLSAKSNCPVTTKIPCDFLDSSLKFTVILTCPYFLSLEIPF